MSDLGPEFDPETRRRLENLRWKFEVRGGIKAELPVHEERVRLFPDKPIQATYREGFPMKLVLTGDSSESAPCILEIGTPKDLGVEVVDENGRAVGDEIVVLDRPLAALLREGLGLRVMPNGSSLVIGRNHLKGSFRYPVSVSREHVSINREDMMNPEGKREIHLNFKDLHSSLGSSLIISGVDPSTK